jgi:hypothetical protein
MVFHAHLVSAIDGSEWSLPGFGIGMTLANSQIAGKLPLSQMAFMRYKRVSNK